jgi:hypothetical protein
MVMSGMSVMPLCLSLAGDCEPLPKIVQNMGGGEVGGAMSGEPKKQLACIFGGGGRAGSFAYSEQQGRPYV